MPAGNDDAKEPVVKKSGKGPEEMINTRFVGPDGKHYWVDVRGSDVYVNGTRMLSNEDGPCEYVWTCPDINKHCSREGRSLDKGPEEGCAIYTTRKINEGYEWVPDKGWVKKAQ
jgi:hypothetical protein